MPSLIDAAEAFSKLGKKSVEIEQSSCVRVRHRHASCNACLRVCAHEAITIENNTLSIESTLCTGCGACASVCPTEALRLIDDANERARSAIDRAAEAADPAALANEKQEAKSPQATSRTIAIACEYLRNQESISASNSATGEGALSVPGRGTKTERLWIPCLAALDESTLIHAACAGVSLEYVSADCTHCPNRCGTLIGDIIDQAERFCAELPGRPFGNVRIRPQWRIYEMKGASPSANTSPEMTRRGMFDHFVAHTTDSVAEAAVSTFYVGAHPVEEKPTLAQSLLEDDGKLRHITVERNAQILDDLYRNAADLDETDKETEPESVISTRLFGEVNVDASLCNLCGICMNFCPSRALSGTANPPMNLFVAATRATTITGELAFRANDCVACQLCADICPHDALEVRRGIRACDLFALEPHTLIKR